MGTTRRRFRTTLSSGVECFWSELSGNAEAEKFDNTNQIVDKWMATTREEESYPYVLVKSSLETNKNTSYISITIMTEAGFNHVVDGQPARYGVNIHLFIQAPSPSPYHGCNTETASRQGLAIFSGVNDFNWAVENVESQHDPAFSATEIDGPRGRRLLALGLPYTVRRLDRADIRSPAVEFLMRGDYVDNRWTEIKFYRVIYDTTKEPLETTPDKIIRKEGGTAGRPNLYFHEKDGTYSPVFLSTGRWIAKGPTGELVDAFNDLTDPISKEEVTTDQPNPGIVSRGMTALGSIFRR